MRGNARIREGDSARTDRRIGLLIAAVALAAIPFTQPAHAQVNPFRGYKGPILTKEDRTAAASAAQTLLRQEPAAVGQAETWVGPKTGNQGTFTIRRIFQKGPMPCRAVTSQVIYKRTQTKREYTLTVCRIATGEWKFAD